MKVLDIEIDIPDHSSELNKINNKIEEIRAKFSKEQENNIIEKKKYVAFYEKTMQILEYVGQLSMPAMNIQTEIEDIYFKQYKHSPELAKKLCNDEYHLIHRPYNLIKNRTYRLLDDLEEYIK